MNDKAYARCKACDKAFYPKLLDDDTFEDMCSNCITRSDEGHGETDAECVDNFISNYIQEFYNE